MARLRAFVAQMAAATAAGDTERLVLLNESFHDAIHDISRCRLLQRMLVGQRIYVHTARILILSDADERARALAEHTRRLRGAGAPATPTPAEKAMREHVVRSAHEHVKTAFDRRRETQP